MIPSHINLVGSEIEMIKWPDRESYLKKALAPIRDRYDYIIIDCSPSLGFITVNCLTAADSVMIPVQPEFFALEGLAKLLQTIRLVQNNINPGLTIEGRLSEAPSHGKPIVLYDVTNNGTSNYLHLAEEVLSKNENL